MKLVKLGVAIGLLLLLAAATTTPAAHAQYVGGTPPPAGPTDTGTPSNELPGGPTEVLGQQFSRSDPASAVGQKAKKASKGFFGSISLADVLEGLAAIGMLALLWFLFAWKRRRDEDDEEEMGFPAPA